jgi:hypothetical protein
MKQVSLFLLMLLMMPMTALGMEPMDLLMKMNAVPGTAYSLTAHVHMDGAYVSIWSKGTMSMTSPLVDAQATVDIVYQELNMRLKGDIKMNEDGMFLLVREVSGDYDSEFAKSTSNAYMKKWLRVADAEMIELFGAGNMMMIDEDLTSSNDMFTVQSVPNAQGKTYILQLTPDAAAGMAQDLFDSMGGDRPAIQDFFPWRALAESIQFEVKVQENAQGTLTSRTANVNLTGEQSYLKITTSETFLSTVPAIVTPEGAMSLDDLIMEFSGFDPSSLEEPYESEEYYEGSYYDEEFGSYDEGMLQFGEEWSEEDVWSDDSWYDEGYEVWSGDCASEPSSTLISLQRSGECPVEKVSRRNLSNTR